MWIIAKWIYCDKRRDIIHRTLCPTRCFEPISILREFKSLSQLGGDLSHFRGNWLLLEHLPVEAFRIQMITHFKKCSRVGVNSFRLK